MSQFCYYCFSKLILIKKHLYLMSKIFIEKYSEKFTSPISEPKIVDLVRIYTMVNNLNTFPLLISHLFHLNI